MDPEDIAIEALLAGGNFGVGTPKLFPTLSEPGLSYSFQSTFSSESSNNDSDSRVERKTEKKPLPEKKVHRTPPKKKKKKQRVIKSKEYYKKKFFKTKKLAKYLVFENAALHDDITNTEHQLSRAKGERKFLLKRLFHYLPMTEAQALQSSAALKSLAANFQGKLPPTVLGPVQPGSQLAAPPLVGTQPPPKKKKKKKKKKQPSESSNRKSAELTPKQVPQKQNTSGEKSDKPKRKKPGTAMKRKVQSIPVDDAGKPIFPIVLGGLTVNSLGDIIFDRNGFHSERYIWPVGYCSCRAYPSMITPERRVLYTCRILDGATEPLFEIVPEDEPDNPVTASTATACHCAILKRLNKARGKETTNTGSGPEFFGFSHPTIQYLIQCLPNTTRLEKFQPVKFELPVKGPVPTMESESQDNSDSMPLAISQSPFFGIKQESPS